MNQGGVPKMHKDLWNARREHNKTQVDVANYLGISPKQYGEKERGKASFTLEEAEKISTFIHVPITEIFPEYFFVK